MPRYLLKRLGQIILVTWLVTLVVFSLDKFAPGDAVSALIVGEYDENAVEVMKKRFGFDKPYHVQYLTWIGRALRGDLGISTSTKRPVMYHIKQTLPVTLLLSLLSMLYAFAVALPLGVVAGIKARRLADHTITSGAYLGISMANFWLALVLIWVVSFGLGLLPVSGYVEVSKAPLKGLQSLVLPAIAVGTAYAALLTMMVRTSVIEQLNRDYVKAARAKGLPPSVIVLKHVLPNALLPVIAAGTASLTFIQNAGIVIEQLFSLPGMGALMLPAIFGRDIFLVQGCILVYTVLFLASMLVADILYTYLNPMIRYEGQTAE